MSDNTQSMRVPAVKLVQNGRTLFLFTIEGKRLREVAAVSHLERNKEGEVVGYQRPEVAAHIANIRKYIEGDKSILPNSLIVALDKRVTFEAVAKEYPDIGYLDIPLVEEGKKKPAFLVDGQQRAAAIRDAEVTKFPIGVVGFVSRDLGDQAEQFILVNSVRPLPKALIYELLPATKEGASLPLSIMKRKLAAIITQRLNQDEDSPFRYLVKMPSNPKGVIQDNSLMTMVEASVADGALADYRGEDETFDVEGALSALKSFWVTVKTVFADAWGKKPKESRLSHAAGVRALGLIFDSIVARHRESGMPDQKTFQEELGVLAQHCYWTEGSWKISGGNRPWDSIQSTPIDINLLCDHMLRLYKRLIWTPKAAKPPRPKKKEEGDETS